MRKFLVFLLLALVFLSQTIDAKPNSKEESISSSKNVSKEKLNQEKKSKSNNHDHDDDEDDDDDDDDEENEHIKSRLEEMKKKLESRTHFTKVSYVTPRYEADEKPIQSPEVTPKNEIQIKNLTNSNQSAIAEESSLVSNLTNSEEINETKSSNAEETIYLDVPASLLDTLLARIKNEFAKLKENRSLLVFLVLNNSTKEIKMFEPKEDVSESFLNNTIHSHHNNSLNISHFIHHHHHELEDDQNVNYTDSQMHQQLDEHHHHHQEPGHSNSSNYFFHQHHNRTMNETDRDVHLKYHHHHTEHNLKNQTKLFESDEKLDEHHHHHENH